MKNYDEARLSAAVEEIKNVTGVTDLDTVIVIDGNDNMLYLISAAEWLNVIGEYTISASKYGYGYERGSNQTPWGVHVIDSKYGAGQPSGMCFYDRRPTGEIATIYTDTTNVKEDPVTSRIIWLRDLKILTIRLIGVLSIFTERTKKDCWARLSPKDASA